MSQVPAGGSASFVARSRGYPRLHELKQNSPCLSRIRAMGYCRIPSLQGTRVVSSWLKHRQQWCCCSGTSWPWTPNSSNDWPVRLFPRPLHPFPLPPCELLFRGVSSPACPLRSRCTPQPRRYPVDHSIRSMHERPCGPVNGKTPPQASRPPDSRGGHVHAAPVVEDHTMCRRSRIPMSIANAEGPSTSSTT